MEIFCRCIKYLHTISTDSMSEKLEAYRNFFNFLYGTYRLLKIFLVCAQSNERRVLHFILFKFNIFTDIQKMKKKTIRNAKFLIK